MRLPIILFLPLFLMGIVSAQPALACTAPFFTFMPVNGLVYNQTDSVNTLVFTTIANSLAGNTLININGTQAWNLAPNAIGGNYLSYGWNTEWVFTNQPANVVVQCIPSSGQASYLPIINSLGINRYSLSALILFCMGICLFVVVLLNIFGVINLWHGTFIGGLANMVLAFSVVIILVFSGFYTEAIVQTGYTITTANVITKVAPISISSLPLASNTILYAVIILFSIVSAVIGGTGLYFIAFMTRENRRKRREKRAAE